MPCSANRHNIVFIGGIHGAGKTQLSKQLSEELKIPHYIASDIIKKHLINPYSNDKKVFNLDLNQDALLVGINQEIPKDKLVLLDGHFVLFNVSGNIEKISFDVFRSINPICIVIVKENVSIIKDRIKNRDAIDYSYNQLEQMQSLEIHLAEDVAQELGCKYYVIESSYDSQSDIDSLIQVLSSLEIR